MITRKLSAQLLLAGFIVAAFAAETETKKTSAEPKAATEKPEKKGAKHEKEPQHVCALNITWWQEPTLPAGERMELGVLVDKAFEPNVLQTMTIGFPFQYAGGPEVVNGRKAKVTETVAKGKTTTSEKWLPYANLTISASDTELLVLLIPSASKPLASVRSFDISPTGFPYGSIMLLNYSKSKVGCLLDGKAFYADPGKRSLNPAPFTQRQVVNFRMGALDKEGTLHQLVSSPMIVDGNARRIYFISETPGVEDDARFRIDALVDHAEDHPKPQAAIEPKPDKKSGAKEPAKKAAPKAEAK